MASKHQVGDVRSLTVHDQSKKATIQFFAVGGDPPFGLVELKLTDDNETAYNAMVSAAETGLTRGGLIGTQSEVKYDSGDMEVDEITIR
jgi:hypothetical protein